jgi:ankyrin repeat protein
LVAGANLVAADHKGRQPAHLAAMHNHVKILRMLFDHGVDLDCTCEAGKTPLHYAAQYGGKMKLLVNGNMSVNILESPWEQRQLCNGNTLASNTIDQVLRILSEKNFPSCMSPLHPSPTPTPAPNFLRLWGW